MRVKKKIILFSGFYLPFLGGIERYTERLSKELTKLGYRVVIVTSKHHAELPSIEGGDVTVYRLPVYQLFQNRYPLPKLGRDHKELMKKVEAEKGDIVICNTRFQLTTLIGLRFAKRNNLKTLVIEHGSSHFSIGVRALDFFGGIYEHFLTMILKRYEAIYYGVSKSCNEWLKHFGITANGVFYNSVDSGANKQFSGRSGYSEKFQNKVVITYAGRVMQEKGVQLLLDAYTEISTKYQDSVLVIAGDGPLLAELKNTHVSPQVIFEGRLDYEDLMQLLDATDIFCHPSMYPEGLPSAILEAGIMKTAVVATARGGTSEVISSEDYGIIVDESKSSLTQALEDLLTHTDKIRRLKNNLYERVKRDFTWEVTAKKVDEVIKEVTS